MKSALIEASLQLDTLGSKACIAAWPYLHVDIINNCTCILPISPILPVVFLTEPQVCPVPSETAAGPDGPVDVAKVLEPRR